MKQRDVLEAFMPVGERVAVRMALRGEERDYFKQRMAALQAVLDSMPVTGDTDAQGDAAVCHLHYFAGSCDVWLTELDKGAPDDKPEDYQSQAFGLVDLGYGSELGYVSIPEVIGAGMELDLHWKPVTVGEIMANRGQKGSKQARGGVR
jgi:hypothetical protein